MSNTFVIHPSPYSIDAIVQGLDLPLSLSAESRQAIIKGRDFLEKKIAEADAPIYGINTGFGSLCNTPIGPDMLAQLQVNLVKSHACGVGQAIDKRISKLIFLLKIIGLSKGNSGVSLDLIEHMIRVYNRGAIPVIYEYGSLGASGDLAPLAHLALVLIGEGEVWEDDSIKSAEQWYKKEGLEAIQLKSKEGISLLNGTQFMSAFGLWNVYMLDKILGIANHCAAISLEAFSGSIDPFRQELHELRNSEGQIAVAKHICEILAGSKQLAKKKSYVQDPYSFRCVPQVHGASWTALQHVKSIVENEINAVTDNPTLLFKENVVVSGGNFHGQPLALAYEYACMATAELGSISERRIYKLLSGERGLPAFLVDEPGINSGFMIPQYTAASLVNRNKQLCAPNVTDTIDSSNGQEDHVSMGANVASKWKQIVDNVIQILAIEMLTANQALEFTDSELSSDKVHLLHVQYRKEIPFIKQDQILHHYIKKSLKFIHEHFDLYI